MVSLACTAREKIPRPASSTVCHPSDISHMSRPSTALSLPHRPPTSPQASGRCPQCGIPAKAPPPGMRQTRAEGVLPHWLPPPTLRSSVSPHARCYAEVAYAKLSNTDRQPSSTPLDAALASAMHRPVRHPPQVRHPGCVFLFPAVGRAIDTSSTTSCLPTDGHAPG